MSHYVNGPARLPHTPAAAHRGSVEMDHVMLMPASLLPFKNEWQAVADGLPDGGVLLVVPLRSAALQRTLAHLVPQLRAQGRHTTIVLEDRFPGHLPVQERHPTRHPTELGADEQTTLGTRSSAKRA